MCEIIFWNNVPWLDLSALNFLLDLPLTREMDKKGAKFTVVQKSHLAIWQNSIIQKFKFCKIAQFFYVSFSGERYI